jgi:predicted nucleotidyltransferase
VSPLNISDFLEALSRWASAQPDIEAVALVGSYARGAASAGSDIDLVILTSDVDRYLRDRSWCSVFGDVAECREEDYGG